MESQASASALGGSSRTLPSPAIRNPHRPSSSHPNPPPSSQTPLPSRTPSSSSLDPHIPDPRHPTYPILCPLRGPTVPLPGHPGPRHFYPQGRRWCQSTRAAAPRPARRGSCCAPAGRPDSPASAAPRLGCEKAARL